MNRNVYGYVRVSTKSQNEERQLIAMRKYGVEDKNIIVEKRSGKDFARPGYRRLLRRLRPGDTLVVESLDRLGRDFTDIQEQWRVITRERGVSIVVLDMPLLNTQEDLELVNQFISGMVLQIMSFVAQTERESIRARQREGIDAAMARGVRFGRPRIRLPKCFRDIVAAWRKGRYTALEAARRLGVSRSTFFRRVRELIRERSAERLAAAMDTGCMPISGAPFAVQPLSAHISVSARAECRHLPPILDFSLG